MPQHVRKLSSNSAVYETLCLITIYFTSEKSYTIEQKTAPPDLFYSWAFNSVPGMSGYKRGYLSVSNIYINSKNVNFIFFFILPHKRVLLHVSPSCKSRLNCHKMSLLKLGMFQKSQQISDISKTRFWSNNSTRIKLIYRRSSYVTSPHDRA